MEALSVPTLGVSQFWSILPLMVRRTLLLALLASVAVLMYACKKQDPEPSSMEDVQKASVGKKNIYDGPAPGTIAK